MNHRATPQFWVKYRALPNEIQQLADRCYKLLRENPQHPSLQFKPLRRDVWSVRVGQHYRALAALDGNDYGWFWIGTHAEYDSIIAR